MYICKFVRIAIYNVEVCVGVYVSTCVHRRMGTLWLGGAEGLICPKFYTDKNRSTKFY